MSCSSDLIYFGDGRWVIVELRFCGMLLPEFVLHSIFEQLSSSFFSIRLVSVHVHPYSRMDMTAAWKKLRFIYQVGQTSIWRISSLSRWRHRLPWHCRWYSARRYFSPIPVHNLPRLRNSNVDRLMKDSFTLKKAKSRLYFAQTITDTDYADDIALLAHTPSQAESLQHSLEQAAGGIGLHAITDKKEYMCFIKIKQTGISLKLVDKIDYLGKWYQYASSIYVYNLPWGRTTNAHKSNERK